MVRRSVPCLSLFLSFPLAFAAPALAQEAPPGLEETALDDSLFEEAAGARVRIVRVQAETPAATALRELEAAILEETNTLRRDPRAYAQKLMRLRPSYRGRLIQRPGQPSIVTQEGVAALDEAVAALAKAPQRLSRLAHAAGLSRAARDHARDLGRSGELGHVGRDGSGPDTRARRHGTWDGMVAENISFGPTSAEEIIIGLLVDDGVPDRGHREILLTRDLYFAGAACGPHPTYGTACVMTYATSFKTRGAADGALEEGEGAGGPGARGSCEDGGCEGEGVALDHCEGTATACDAGGTDDAGAAIPWSPPTVTLPWEGDAGEADGAIPWSPPAATLPWEGDAGEADGAIPWSPPAATLPWEGDEADPEELVDPWALGASRQAPSAPNAGQAPRSPGPSGPAPARADQHAEGGDAADPWSPGPLKPQAPSGRPPAGHDPWLAPPPRPPRYVGPGNGRPRGYPGPRYDYPPVYRPYR